MDYPLSQAGSLGLKDGKFTDGVPGLYQASIIPSGTTNDIVDEILAVQVEGGVVKDETNKTQLKTAIKNMIEARVGDFVVDTGATNAYVVAMNPPITVYSATTQGQFKSSHANTLASTLNAGGGVRPLVRSDGGPTKPGDIPLNGIVSFAYDTTTSSFVITGMVPSQATGRLLRTVVFTASGTWTAGDGTTAVEVEVVGGGAGGGGTAATSSQNAASTGGGGGGYARKFIQGVASPQTVTIGAGGAGSTGNATATVGGTSSFGSLASATGGGGGNGGAAVVNSYVVGGLGGIGAGGDINIPGSATAAATASAGAPGSGSAGGNSMYGAGALASSNSNGSNGRGYGAGGGGALAGQSLGALTGGTGTNGIVIVKEYA